MNNTKISCSKESEVKTGRIEWIDILKGFAIVLVMFGHAIFPNLLKIEIYSFHIPLFFFLSGYVFSIKKYKNFKEFFISKLKSLIIPLGSFSIIIFLFHLIFNYLIVKDMELRNILFEPIGLLLQIRGTFLGGSIWFLTCLFSCEIMFYFILKITKDNEKTIIIFLLLSSIIGYMYFKYINFLLPWAVDASLTAIVFLGLGYIAKKNSKFIDNLINVKYLILFLIVNIISCYCNYIFFNTSIDLYACKLGNYFLYYITSISGIFMCICTFRLIKGMNLLKKIGENSLIYYCLHMIIFKIINFLLKGYINLNTNAIYEQLFIGILMVSITVLVIFYISKLINKKFSFILGKF